MTGLHIDKRSRNIIASAAHAGPAADALLTRRDFAQRVGVSVPTVDGWVRKAGLPVLRIGRRTTRIKWSDGLRFLEERARAYERERLQQRKAKAKRRAKP